MSFPSLLKRITAPVGLLGFVAYNVGQRSFRHFQWEAGDVPCPITET
jgi:hypothetical protein